jgi:hypothetical protein
MGKARTAAASAENMGHVENTKALFGKHPVDVISPIRSAAEVLGWLEEIFQVISREAEAARMNTVRVKSLADAGAYLASDFGNYVGVEHETMLESFRLCGIVAEGANHD